jgi:hypothetical protein
MLGNLLGELGQLAEAEYRRALDLQQKLTADFPAVPEYRHDLALSQGNLGSLLRASGKLAEAEAAHRRALDQYEKLAAEFPAVPRYRAELAGSPGSFRHSSL